MRAYRRYVAIAYAEGVCPLRFHVILRSVLVHSQRGGNSATTAIGFGRGLIRPPVAATCTTHPHR